QKVNSTQPSKMGGEEPFVWPDWNIQVCSMAFQNNHLFYQNGEKPGNVDGFNPDYINLKDFTLKADDIVLAKNEKLQANINAFSFQEASGLTLEQLGFALSLDRQHMNIENFNFKFNHSSLAANLSARYSSID